jgi:hypothetical protein
MKKIILGMFLLVVVGLLIAGCGTGEAAKRDAITKSDSIDEAKCLRAEECPRSGLLGETFCLDGDVYDTYRTYKCVGIDCVSSDSNRLVEDCAGGCENSICIPEDINLFVDQNNPSCSDTYTREENTRNNPWCTVARANDLHLGGDTVHILPGDYRETIEPKPGAENNPTIYNGYGEREEVKILGSDAITGWTQCSSGDPNCAGIPSQNLQYIYYASFTADGSRWEKFNQPNPPGAIQCLGGGYDCEVYTTDCFEDRQNWFVDADLGYSGGIPIHHVHPSGAYDIDESGKYYYDYNNSLVYIWSFNSDDPNNHVVECSNRRTSSMIGDYITIQSLTIMHSLDKGLSFEQNAEQVNVLDNELMFNSGSGTYANNPSALYKESSYDVLAGGFNIIGNKIHDQGSDRGPVITGCVKHCGAGMTLYSIKNSIIKDNEIYNTAEGVYLKTQFRKIETINNVVYDTAGHCIEYGISQNLETGSILGNLLYNCGETGITTRGDSHNLEIYGNTIWNADVGIDLERYANQWPAGDNFFIKDNIISKVSESFISLWWNTSSTTESDFNLFFDTQQYFGITSYDGYPGITYNTIQEWQSGTGFDINSFETDPLFVSTGNANFKLQPASPAIDAGTVIPGYHCDTSGPHPGENCREWYGTAPDIGAFEYTRP